jgi:hypothetical protein
VIDRLGAITKGTASVEVVQWVMKKIDMWFLVK